MYANKENVIIVSITKRMEIITSVHVCLISWMNFNYSENSGKKSFSRNPNHQDRISQYGEHDSNANNKNNGNYYKNPSLSHFVDEL